MLLTTPRLRIRPMVPGDFRLFADMAQDEEVMKFIRKPDLTDATSRIKFEECLQTPLSHPDFGLFIVTEKSSGNDLGWIMLKPDIEGIPCHEIGYRYTTQAWGKGFASEAAVALAQYGRNTLGLLHLIGITHLHNLASKKVLQKAGLNQLEGTFSFFDLEVNIHAWGQLPQEMLQALKARKLQQQ